MTVAGTDAGDDDGLGLSWPLVKMFGVETERGSGGKSAGNLPPD